MFIDSRTLIADEEIQTEVCIIGAGPAGITLAREFIGQNFRVCLLESGGLEFDRETQTLSDADTIGDRFPKVRDMRVSQFGGHANVWNVELDKNAKQFGLRHVPFDDIDFEKRDCIPYSGWCFNRSHLNPYYERAQSVCKLGPLDYGVDTWENHQSPRLPFSSDRVTTGIFQFGPRDIFTNEYRQEINKSPNITTYLYANVVEIVTDEIAKNVTRVHVACLQGNKFSVVAKIFILAANGIENARLLLLSNQVQKTGLGNQNDVVGRFFMDHPSICSGIFYPSNPKIFKSTSLYDLQRLNNMMVMGKLQISEQVMRQEQLQNMSFMLFPRDKNYRSPAKNSAKVLSSSLKQGKLPQNAFKHLSNVITNIDNLTIDWYKYHLKKEFVFPNLSFGGWSRPNYNDGRYVKFEVISQAEQVPHPDNRITLSKKLDKLGCPQAQLTFNWSEIDTHSIKRSQEILKEEITRAGLGRFEIEENEGLPNIISFSTHHNMGTTRMHIDPKQGVVNENLQVHGVSNLFFVGSSVFPTGSYANPTLTIVALALRLADHMMQHLH